MCVWVKEREKGNSYAISVLIYATFGHTIACTACSFRFPTACFIASTAFTLHIQHSEPHNSFSDTTEDFSILEMHNNIYNDTLEMHSWSLLSATKTKLKQTADLVRQTLLKQVLRGLGQLCSLFAPFPHRWRTARCRALALLRKGLVLHTKTSPSTQRWLCTLVLSCCDAER